MIDVSGGAATLTDAALDPSIRIFGPGATVAEIGAGSIGAEAEDLELE